MDFVLYIDFIFYVFNINRTAKQWYLHGIKGITVQTQGAPCIAQLEFVFVVIEDSESIEEQEKEREEDFFYFLNCHITVVHTGANPFIINIFCHELL